MTWFLKSQNFNYKTWSHGCLIWYDFGKSKFLLNLSFQLYIYIYYALFWIIFFELWSFENFMIFLRSLFPNLASVSNHTFTEQRVCLTHHFKGRVRERLTQHENEKLLTVGTSCACWPTWGQYLTLGVRPTTLQAIGPGLLDSSRPNWACILGSLRPNRACRGAKQWSRGPNP